jgi:hypothetical protein
MSIWKSPVFYFGVLLALLVSAALAAPYLVPWNNYRNDLQNFGARLTGRDVTIGGDIDVKLFPWPQLTARDVTIANPVGFSEGAFVKADELRVTLSLAGFFNGNLDVQSVEAVSPQVNLQRNATGDVNWIFAPTEKVAGSGLLARVKLDQISLSQGIISFDDLRNGYSSVLSGLDASLSADSILGPWRMRGDAKWRDMPVGVQISTNAKEAGKPLKVTVKALPRDMSYPLFGLDGSWDGKNFNGFVRVEPQESKDAKASAEGTFKPLAMQAEVSATESSVSLLKVKIAPADRKDSGTLIEGAAVVELGTQAKARIDLKSPRINLDTLVGAGTMRTWRDGGFLSVSNALLASMPSKLEVDYKLLVNTLTSGGQTVNDVRVSGVVQKEAIRVNEFAAELPGRSSGTFDGILFPGPKAAQLAGSLTFDSGDMRAFLGWLDPSWRPAFEKHWKGSRGRLQIVNGKIDWRSDRFNIENATVSFEGSQGQARLALDWSTEPRMELSLALGQLDIDSLAPQGFSFVGDGGAGAVLASLIGQDQASTKRFVMRFGAVTLNGVSAQESSIDMELSPKGFVLRSLDVGNVSGARLRGSGELSDKSAGLEGAVSFKLEAENPLGFLQMLGVERKQSNWVDALGQTAMDATLRSIPQKSGPELELSLKGKTGSLLVDLSSSARDLGRGLNAAVALTGSISSDNSSDLFRLFGVTPFQAAGSGKIAIEASGSLDQGVVFSLNGNALNATGVVEGKLNVLQPWFGINGKFEVQSSDGEAIMNATGVPLDAGSGQPLNASAVVSAKDGVLSFIDLKGNFAGRRLSGSAGVTADSVYTADVETDSLDAKEVLLLAFMSWEGPPLDRSESFAQLDENSLKVEVFVRPLQFDPLSSAPIREAVIAIGSGTLARQLSITSPGENGLKLDAKLTTSGSAYDVSGSMTWPIDIKSVIAKPENVSLADGQLVVKGDFLSRGRGPATVLAGLDGKGTYGLSGAVFSKMTLDGLSKAIASANSPDQLSLVLKNLEAPPGTEIGQRVGTIEAKSGELSFSPFELKPEGILARVSPKYDAMSNNLTIDTNIELTSPTGLPALTVSYAGTPGALATRTGTSALAAKLGYDLLSKEMAKLEELQKEQEAIAAKEEAQRKADEQRFADYQSTREELREQARVRRFHKLERDRRESEIAALVEFAVKNGPSMNRVELQRHARRLEVRRTLVQP